MKISELPASVINSLKLRYGTSVQRDVDKPQIPVIVSLTSIPSRLHTLDITIESLKRQSVVPEKIILWLHEKMVGQLPTRLEKMQDKIFEIRYSPFTFSHRKLIHCLDAFPEKAVITCDDDVIYDSKVIETLYNEHKNYPNHIIGNRCRAITYKNGELLSYNNWPFVDGSANPSNFLMPVGAFCTIYPPNSLDPLATDVDLFMELAPKADDLWFKAMALKKGTLSRCNSQEIQPLIPIMGTQKIALKKINKDRDYNRVQWLQICEYFKWDEQKIEELIQSPAV